MSDFVVDYVSGVYPTGLQGGEKWEMDDGRLTIMQVVLLTFLYI